MYENHAYALGCYTTVDQLALSRQAERAVEHRRAVRAQKLERKEQRKRRRALRRHQEAYTTAV